MRELALSYGVVPVFIEKKKSVDEFIRVSLKDLLSKHDLDDNDIIVVLAGQLFKGCRILIH